MDRRHFVKLSTLTSASLLFGRLTSFASDISSLINPPDEAWAKSGEKQKSKQNRKIVFSWL